MEDNGYYTGLSEESYRKKKGENFFFKFNQNNIFRTRHISMNLSINFTVKKSKKIKCLHMNAVL